MTIEEQDEKEFDELMWEPELSLRWNKVARQWFLDVWLASRRTLREQIKADPYPKDKFIIAKRHRSSMDGES